MRELAPERRRRLIFRALPAVGVLAVLALAAGLMVGSGAPVRRPSARPRTSPAPGSAATCRAMYALLDERSRASYSLPAFRRAYARSAATATVDPGGGGRARGRARRRGGGARGGAHPGLRRDPGTPAGAGAATSTWPGRPSLTFPGLPAGARLSRRSRPPRAGVAAARATARCSPRAAPRRSSSPLGGLAASIAGMLGAGHDAPPTAPGSTRAASRATGRSGENGLERAFEGRAGRACPAGVLLAGDRVLAQRRAAQGRARSARRSTPTSRRPRWPRSPAASAASPRSTRAPARSARWPASPSPRPSRPGRPSRSSPPPPRWRRGP